MFRFGYNYGYHYFGYNGGRSSNPPERQGGTVKISFTELKTEPRRNHKVAFPDPKTYVMETQVRLHGSEPENPSFLYDPSAPNANV